MELTDPLLDLAARRTRELVGGMLNGIVHNLNNPVHALTMQTELLQKVLGKDDLDVLRDNLQDKCARMQRVVLELKSQLEVLAWRDAYVNPDSQLVDPAHFGNWLLQFWQADLLFKHSVTANLSVDPPPPHVQAVPLALTWCLEEPLAALLRCCEAMNGPGMHALALKVGPLPSMGLEIQMRTKPPSEDIQTLDVPIPYASEIRKLASGLGWDWEAGLVQGVLAVRVVIAGKTAT